MNLYKLIPEGITIPDANSTIEERELFIRLCIQDEMLMNIIELEDKESEKPSGFTIL